MPTEKNDASHAKRATDASHANRAKQDDVVVLRQLVEEDLAFAFVGGPDYNALPTAGSQREGATLSRGFAGTTLACAVDPSA